MRVPLRKSLVRSAWNTVWATAMRARCLASTSPPPYVLIPVDDQQLLIFEPSAIDILRAIYRKEHDSTYIYPCSGPLVKVHLLVGSIYPRDTSAEIENSTIRPVSMSSPWWPTNWPMSSRGNLKGTFLTRSGSGLQRTSGASSTALMTARPCSCCGRSLSLLMEGDHGGATPAPRRLIEVVGLPCRGGLGTLRRREGDRDPQAVRLVERRQRGAGMGGGDGADDGQAES